MYEGVIEGLMGIITWKSMMLMVVGVAIASFFAAAPGIGGLLLLSLLMPYAITLHPYEFIALIIGAATVGNTANTFTSVLVGVPGGAGAQATVLDGYPMAKKGEANRAFGAAFLGSAVGAVIGAATFILTLPIFTPLVLALGSPEFLMLVLWGLSAVSVLGGKSPVKGLLGAVIGIGIALIGTDTRTGIERFTFGTGYLESPLSVVIIAMGIFAMPEMFELMVKRTRIAEVESLGSGLVEGMKDVFRHWWLVVRSSMVGVWVGVLPGLGSSVADWFAYAHAVQTEKNTENFGKGDVRGVLAPESSNNAKEGGDLIPTLLFGIPGGSSMAIILIGLYAVGIQTGEPMLTTQRPYMFAMIWTLVIANFMATGLALVFAKQFSKACMVSYYYLVPAILMFCLVGAFSVNLDLPDIAAFVVFTTIGIILKRYGWPRPPLLVAVVLGPQVQQYLWLSVDRYGYEWMTHTGVIIIFLIIIATICWPIYRQHRAKTGPMDMELVHEVRRPIEQGSIALALTLAAIFAYMVWQGTHWPLRASIAVYFVAALGVLLVTIQVVRDFVELGRIRRGVGEAIVAYTRQEKSREIEAVLWIAGLVVSVLLVGFHLSFVVFPLLYARAQGGDWRQALWTSLGGLVLLIFVFDFMYNAIWPKPLLTGWLYTLAGM
jgi:TctA family transporter